MAGPSRILVPVDLKDGSRSVVDYALQLARPFGATVDILHAWEPPQYVAPDLLVASPGWDATSLEAMARDTAGKELEALLRKVDGTAPVALSHRVVIGEAGNVVLEEAERGKYDLIVMGTHQRKGLTRMLLGSVAQKVVGRAACPVLTLHVSPE
ncbi:universal stress protein [Corallococcus sp. CA054B]|uniref:universal stress protein n=1 Tax=unclassified Corallococcus TaxID=2685029 RepID=UPI000EA0F8F7|nr:MULTISPECIES: universal stress protein [unclassified Corallococcus]RKG59332.1 universal stress protein [Corallococcus sp. CA054B]RKG59836.1 universal stress protein [Corallococcus sp. AB011P]RKH77887.1 universal stress protein [Corallococcus sp. AB045]